ncbi:MAG TPA: AMP-binding protein [Burkholderiales bacterium]|nr:AMP-binding protein [Burkholderiales bacterium]
MPDRIRSAINGLCWPAIPSAPAGSLLALQYQLECSQWYAPERLHEVQFSQLRQLLRHAAETAPFYRERFARSGFDPASATPESFAQLPLLTRHDIHNSGAALISGSPPADHGRALEFYSGGSTGEPVKTFGNELTHFFWGALQLRDHLWQRRDVSGTFAVTRTGITEAHRADWGPPVSTVYESGPSFMIDIGRDVREQLVRLREIDPDYLMTHPTNLRALATESLAQRASLPALRQVITFGEALPSGLRALARDAWNVELKDIYSAEEVGYIALQCPEYPHYHVQSENLLVEVLDDDGRPCAPGEIGRVVITTLHNFTMPLIRYVLGDYAEVGGACPCGRGLPVLTRIMGRSRNMVRLPDGSRHWPTFPPQEWNHIALARQFQVAQVDRDEIELRLVLDHPLDAAQERQLAATFRRLLRHPFHVTVRRVERIAASPRHKFEDFVCELPDDD